MKKYVKVYSFSVLSSITEGKEVFCIDKEKCMVTKANLAKAETLLSILEDCKEDDLHGRYEFYCIEEGEAENGNLI